MKFMKYSHSDDNDFQDKVEKQLLFRKVVKVIKDGEQDAELTLDNGTVLRVEGNEGCGGCGNGWFDIVELNSCDNVITNVECINKNEEVYSIFVFAENEKIKLLEYQGYDNGYYGTGYRMLISIDNMEGEEK